MAGLANTGALKGKTIFITGASRGIGLAIGLKAARDGANIIIAAKTAEPHKKLQGTIYTAAKEIESAGGKALAVVTDIRYEDMMESAVEQAVKAFGGIDILVNNASAISLTGTLETPMKKYDLMNNINTRGTFLASKVCLPHLLKASNPHILNLSPPLNMNPAWFQNHVAYTMAKYGMSMCVLGMAQEFKDKVAVNALWPRTAIYTAAMEMIGGGASVQSKCRKVDIMADAAYAILTKPKTFTGNFTIDDEVLQAAGITDMAQYAVDPTQTLVGDFFVGDNPGVDVEDGLLAHAKKAATPGFTAQYFDSLKKKLSADMAKSVGASAFVFDVEGAGKWYVDFRTGNGEVGQGERHTPDVTVTLTETQLKDISMNKASPDSLYMMGKINVQGDFRKAQILGQILTK